METRTPAATLPHSARNLFRGSNRGRPLFGDGGAVHGLEGDLSRDVTFFGDSSSLLRRVCQRTILGIPFLGSFERIVSSINNDERQIPFLDSLLNLAQRLAGLNRDVYVRLEIVSEIVIASDARQSNVV